MSLLPRILSFQSTLPARGATPLFFQHLHRHRDFNPRSPHGERPNYVLTLVEACAFQSTLPARGATRRAGLQPHRVRISIHAPRTGSDRGNPAFRPSYRNFNPRSPHGERRESGRIRRGCCLFQSTLPARGATTFVVHAQKSNISIHAPRTGSDALYFPRIAFARYFNPRSPHGERPSGQPEPPAASNFNPRSPHGERRSARTSPDVTFPFQPTLPARGATLEGDSRDRGPGHFNPRSPHGERPTIQRYTEYLGEFQPTLPARGATRMLDNQIARTFISTHAPRTGSDATAAAYLS